MNKPILLTIAVFILVFISLPFACQYIEEPYRYYQTHTDELYSGNWVPKNFPDDIANIHEKHNIDTNEVWLKFDKSTKPIRTNKLARLSSEEKSKINISMPFLTSWWFEGIIEQQAANDNALYAEIYKGQCGIDMTSYLALSTTSNKVFWWCQYE